jgi:hypothetical protein
MATFILSLLLFVQLIFLLIALLIVYLMFFSIITVPWVRTRKLFSNAMLKFAKVKPDDVVVDFGCGDGSILLEAASGFGVKKAIGIEARYPLVLLAQLRAKWAKVPDAVEIVHGNMFKEKWPEKIDLITVYLLAEFNKKLEPLILERCESGTRVVSRTFTFPGLALVDTTVIKGETVYLYRVP